MGIIEAIQNMIICSGKSKYSLSHDLGKSHAYIGVLLNKRTIPQVNTMIAIADKCDFDLQVVNRKTGEIIKLENTED